MFINVDKLMSKAYSQLSWYENRIKTHARL